MLHRIPVETLGAQGEAMAKAVESCVHCGFCLATCPTYRELGEETDSPRGRILLMKEVLEGSLTTAEALPYIDRCLGCMACVTACPSGVEYGHLLTPFRARAEQERSRPPLNRTVRTLVKETLPYPDRFRLAAQSGRVGRWMRNLLPGEIGAMLDLLPETLPDAPPLPEVYPAQGTRRARVALLAGCVQQVLAPTKPSAMTCRWRQSAHILTPSSKDTPITKCWPRWRRLVLRSSRSRPARIASSA